MRLLLINPRYPESFWSFKWAVDGILPSKRAINPPLGLATLAALCPAALACADRRREHRVDPAGARCRHDRRVRHGRAVRAPERAAALLPRAGITTSSRAAASLRCAPSATRALADTVVAGEAEYVWPRFCADFENGRAGAMYRETGVVALTDSPIPRFDLLKLDRYSTATMQFSRGCPVPLRVLRHHRHVRPQAAHQAAAADRARTRRAARAGCAQRLLRRRQPDRQPGGCQGTAARTDRLPGTSPLPLSLRHRGVDQPRPGRRAAAADARREFRLGVHRHRVLRSADPEGHAQDPEHARRTCCNRYARSTATGSTSSAASSSASTTTRSRLSTRSTGSSWIRAFRPRWSDCSPRCPGRHSTSDSSARDGCA